jgi:hypothetical protein
MGIPLRRLFRASRLAVPLSTSRETARPVSAEVLHLAYHVVLPGRHRLTVASLGVSRNP